MKDQKFTQEELSLIRMLLKKEDSTNLVEINHARRAPEYQDYLKARHREIDSLLEKIEDIMSEEKATLV